MDAHQMIWNETVAREIIQNLEKRRMSGSYAPNAAQAKEEILAMIPEGATVYRGGSMTTVTLGLWEKLSEMPGVRVLDPYKPGLSPEDAFKLRLEGMAADFMIASSNAITLDGKLVNLDATGNRIAAMSFGPKKVLLVVGMNKVAPDLESAMARVKHYSAPVNTIRLGLANPCKEKGLCFDCKTAQRICNMWSIIEGHMIQDRIHVKLIGENLGY
ncbi:MAG: lactate utilization protein [Desulfomonilaceae bacterium]